MLIVDSPFPPYSPVEVDVFAEPDLGDLATAMTMEEIFNWGWTWHSRDSLHRDGDLPAVIEANKKHCIFYKVGVKHRVNGLAVVSDDRSKNETNGWFSLYGYILGEEQFERVNLLAIQHELPLWVAVLTEAFSNQLGGRNKLGAVAQDTLNLLPSINVKWLLQIWGVKPEWWVLNTGGHQSFSSFIENAQKVVDYEKELAAPLR